MDIIKKNMALASSGAGKVRNRAPADVQITAEQLVYDANQRMLEKPQQPAVREVITDPEELAQYRSKRRKVSRPLPASRARPCPACGTRAAGLSALAGRGTRCGEPACSWLLPQPRRCRP